MSNRTELPGTMFVVHENDNVATALGEINPGTVRLIGAVQGTAVADEPICYGHKLALRDIPEGGMVVKYNAPVAVTRRFVKAGEWLHLHNARSLNDTRSADFDAATAAPQDRVYELDDEEEIG